MTNPKIVDVSTLLTTLRKIFEKQPQFQGISVKGEISNLTKHSSGHWYFSLKDDKASVSCVMWRGNNNNVEFTVENGMQVLVKANLAIFEGRGSIQLVVLNMEQLNNIGDLALLYKQRFAKFEKMGYFATSHKKRLNPYPERLAVVSALKGAATQDVMHVLTRRWPLAEKVLFPCLVQGDKADLAIIKQLEIADSKSFDAILLVRGGGSLEDLWCFNSEALVEYIYHMKTPVVVGVGHEPDHTLAEYVADLCAPTPSAAAELVTPNSNELKINLIKQALMYQNRLQKMSHYDKVQLANLKNRRYFLEPQSYIQNEQLKLSLMMQSFASFEKQTIANKHLLANYETRLVNSSLNLIKARNYQLTSVSNKIELKTNNFIQLQKQLLVSKIELLEAYSPLNSIKRGYILAYQDSNLVNKASSLKVDDEVKLQFSDGVVYTKVVGKE